MTDTSSIQKEFDQLGYVLDEELATVLFLTLHLQKPLLLEGPPGVGKTEVANVLAQALDTELIRLQCYEGLDVNAAVYEWNYQKQLLSIKLQEGSQKSEAEKESHIFGEDFLLQRPLLRAITATQKSFEHAFDRPDADHLEVDTSLTSLTGHGATLKIGNAVLARG